MFVGVSRGIDRSADRPMVFGAIYAFAFSNLLSFPAIDSPFAHSPSLLGCAIIPIVCLLCDVCLPQMAVVAGHAASQAGTMASRGAYQSTRVSMRAWSNLMQRSSTTAKARSQVRVRA